MTNKLLGDIVEENLKKIHVDKIARGLEKVTKKPCGCAKRKEKLNDWHKRFQGQH